MLDSAIGWVLAAVGLLIVSLLINLVLYLLTMGNLKKIAFLWKLKKLLIGLPPELPLVCSGKDVSAVAFDPTGGGRERAVPLYAGILTWKGGPRLTSQLKSRAQRQFASRVIAFAIVFVPLMISAIWLTLFVDWWGILIVLILAFHQFVPFYIWEYPGMAGLFDRD